MSGRRPLGRRAAALALLLSWCGHVHATQLQVHADGLSPDQVQATRQLIDDVMPRLPAAWTNALPDGLTLGWRDDLPDGVHGRFHGRQLWLDGSLLDAWMSGEQHASRAALVHELAHAYDRGNRDVLSGDPRLRDLAGWQRSPLPWRVRASRNDATERTPDTYELTRPSEYVAVNLEYFVLDPSFGCRRPALHRHFSTHFGISAMPVDCAPYLPFLEADVESGDAGLLALDPARVHAVDYLLAEGNDQPMSRWGHSMLRLVICAPGRTPGPDCRLDLAHHRVISFRAFVGDVQISGWRGLTGSYPSRLFLLPLDQVIEEYTKVELRGLQSIPLELQQGEIATLLERAAQLHWSYDGRYYFISNNCAVETWRVLVDGVPRLADERLESITPTGLLKHLTRAGIADTSVLADPAEARRMGYYFEPMSARYQQLFEVARESLLLPQRSAQEWLELAPARRAAWLPRADLRASAALLVLENAALRRQQLLLRDALKRRYLGSTRTQPADVADALQALRRWLGDTGFASRPAELVPDGYGLPQADERERSSTEAARRVARLKREDAALRERLAHWLPVAPRDALRGIEANVAVIGQRLRDLHAGQGAAASVQ